MSSPLHTGRMLENTVALLVRDAESGSTLTCIKVIPLILYGLYLIYTT